MKIIAGYDPGRMYSKLHTIIDGKEIKLKGPNAICIGYDRRVDDISKEMEFQNEDLLDITVIYATGEEERFFIGEFARKNHRSDLLTASNHVSKYSRLTADKERGKLFAYLALAGYQANKKELRVRTGLGAPTEEFYDIEGKKELAEFEKGTAEVTVRLNHPKFNGFETRIIPTKMDFVAEGTASAFSAMYDIDVMEMELVENVWMMKQLERGPVYISNLGSSTEDSAILTKSGFDRRGFFGIDVGSSVATIPLQEDLVKTYKFDKDKTTLDHLLYLSAESESKIRYRDELIDLTQMAKPRFKMMLERRNQKVFDKLERNGIDPGDIVAQYQTGGTVEYLKLIKQEEYLKLFKHAAIKISERPHEDEARGYYIASKLQHDLEVAQDAEKHGHEASGKSEEKAIEVS